VDAARNNTHPHVTSLCKMMLKSIRRLYITPHETRLLQRHFPLLPTTEASSPSVAASFDQEAAAVSLTLIPFPLPAFTPHPSVYRSRRVSAVSGSCHASVPMPYDVSLTPPPARGRSHSFGASLYYHDSSCFCTPI